MSALTWDATGERMFEAGLSKGVLYKQETSGTYGTGVAWNGLTAVTESPEGAESNPIYADDIEYANIISKEKFKATIEAYMYPDEYKECDGSAELGEGTGVFIGQQNRKSFGLCYRTAIGNDVDGTDHGYIIHLIYGAKSAPSERAHATINESTEAMTLSWEVSATPVTVTGFKPTSHLEIYSTKCSAENLQKLESALYGTANAEPTLLMPDEIVELIGASAVAG